MMKRKLVLAMTLLTLLLVVTASLTTNVHAATSPTRSSSTNFYTLEKTCAVINVQLHGTQSPTMTCARAKTMSGVSPNTGVKSCSTSGTTMEIHYYGFQYAICFSGTGYWGYRVNYVDEVISPTATNGWVLWYVPGETQGNVCNLNRGNGWVAVIFDSASEPDITQIDPGVNNSHNGPAACGN